MNSTGINTKRLWPILQKKKKKKIYDWINMIAKKIYDFFGNFPWNIMYSAGQFGQFPIEKYLIFVLVFNLFSLEVSSDVSEKYRETIYDRVLVRFILGRNIAMKVSTMHARRVMIAQ